jgi:hypothetical protein
VLVVVLPDVLLNPILLHSVDVAEEESLPEGCLAEEAMRRTWGSNKSKVRWKTRSFFVACLVSLERQLELFQL